MTKHLEGFPSEQGLRPSVPSPFQGDDGKHANGFAVFPQGYFSGGKGISCCVEKNQIGTVYGLEEVRRWTLPTGIAS